MSVSPGFSTPMGELQTDHGASEFLKVVAIKRFGKPEAIVAVPFCASGALGYRTGVDILVDGESKAGKKFRKSSRAQLTVSDCTSPAFSPQQAHSMLAKADWLLQPMVSEPVWGMHRYADQARLRRMQRQ